MSPSRDPVLVINAGSSSLKVALFRPGPQEGTLDLVSREQLEGAEAGAVSLLDEWLLDRLAGERLSAVGHRVVHGGTRFREPVLVTEPVLAALEALVPLAPLHQPHNLAAIREMASRYPGVPQVACFDTAFHGGHARVVEMFALPHELTESGIRRYGFHGLSYEHIARSLVSVAPEIAGGRVVVAHLGNGASLCAMAAGRSVDSTMGFTALDGVTMGTRAGALDPGVLLYLLQSKGFDAARLERFLYHEAGLLGISGISGDMRDLLASDAPAARLAVDHFVFRIVKETGALASVLGGLDGFVFTAGIGEHAAPVREKVCAGLAWLGLTLDAAANARGGPLLTSPESRVAAYVIPTDEERMIALHTVETLQLENS